MSQTLSLAIIVAMQNEAEILAATLSLVRDQTAGDGYTQFTSPTSGIAIFTPGSDKNYLSFGSPVSRVGKVPSSVLTTTILARYRPSAMLNVGTAGGFISSGLNIGDIVLANQVMCHDTHIPIPGYDDYATRRIKTALPTHSDALPPHKVGLVSTGESFTASAEDWLVMRENGALAKDMEVASIAQTLTYLNNHLPFYVIKGITDLNDEGISSSTSSEQFLQNFNLTMTNLANFTKIFLASL